MGGLLSGLLTQATSGLAANEEGKQQGSKLLRDILHNRIDDDLKQSQTTHFNAQTKKLGEPDYETIKTDQGYARVPKSGTTGLINDPTGKPYQVEHPEQTPLPTTGGYVNRDGTPILGPDGKRILPPSMKPPAETKDHFTFITTTGPDGKQIITRANTATGELEDTNKMAKAAGAGGGQSLAPEDRLKMLNQAKLDHETMKEFEGKVLANKASVGMASGVAGALGSAHGTGGVMPGVLAAVGNTTTGKINPEYQKYLTAQRSYGRIMGNLQSKRYSDNQAEIERSISGLGANDLPSTIEYKQRLREASLADPALAAQQQAQATTGGNAAGARPPLADRVQQLKAHGLTKEAVRAQLQHEGYDLHGGD